MPVVGNARVGHRAPAFECDAVIDGEFKAISLDTFTKKKKWLILLFIPAAFSFVCPTEVLAFHNCVDEFLERNCELVFVSTDSKHCLWQWQHLPKSLGGLGTVRVALASDQSHKMSRDYGVLLEGKGMDLRGMFIIDPEGVIQQITINNIAVGRSVLEALRLVEAFKAVAKRGVLCPVDWKPGQETLTESYEGADHDAVREMGKLQVKNLDNNTSHPFTLVLPASKKDKTPGTPGAINPHPSSSPAEKNSMNRNKGAQEYNQKTVTLEFADPLGDINGADSPQTFMSVTDSQIYGSVSEDYASSSPTNIQRGLDALKKLSSGWSTPLPSPGLNGSERAHSKAGSLSSQLRNGYFD